MTPGDDHAGDIVLFFCFLVSRTSTATLCDDGELHGDPPATSIASVEVFTAIFTGGMNRTRVTRIFQFLWALARMWRQRPSLIGCQYKSLIGGHLRSPLIG